MHTSKIMTDRGQKLHQLSRHTQSFLTGLCEIQATLGCTLPLLSYKEGRLI